MNDLISRQAAINEIENTSFDDYGDYMQARKLIEELPPAQIDLSGYSDKLWRNAYERAYCDKDHDPSYDRCAACKTEWLDMEVDE